MTLSALISKPRGLVPLLEADLRKKMVFLGGPRQVGKTTLAKSLLEGDKGYLNWDVPVHRQSILKRTLPSSRLWVFDELHKYRSWRGYLKGLYDDRSPGQSILVTGSARLDLYRFGGDSLQGRYHYWRLHPLSVAELGIKTQGDFRELLALGGFPEPYFSSSGMDAKRWSREYRTRLIHEEVTSLEGVKDLGNMELLMLSLPERVGSPLSINSMRQDLQVNHKTVDRWLQIFERLYALFRIPPFSGPKLRAVRKEQKHYHFDWTLIPGESLAFENMVACHLLKWVHFQQDSRGEEFELRYFRDVDGREIDFIVTLNRKPVLAVECKWKENELNPALFYFHKKFPECRVIQITALPGKSYQTPEGIRLMSALEFLGELA